MTLSALFLTDLFIFLSHPSGCLYQWAFGSRITYSIASSRISSPDSFHDAYPRSPHLRNRFRSTKRRLHLIIIVGAPVATVPAILMAGTGGPNWAKQNWFGKRVVAVLGPGELNQQGNFTAWHTNCHSPTCFPPCQHVCIFAHTVGLAQ